MQEFDTYEKVSALFAAKGFPENAKYCVMWKNTVSKNPFAGGLVGGMVSGMEYPYNALLVALCDTGIAFFHLNSDGVLLANSVKKLNVVPSTYTFVPMANIKALKVARFSSLNSRILTVDIQIANGSGQQSHRLIMNSEEKLLPYHKFGAAAFIEKYSVKK